MITLKQAGSGYRQRTAANAKNVITLAFALDFETAGEKLTKEVSAMYFQMDLGMHLGALLKTLDAVATVGKSGFAPAGVSLNVAGNSLHTFCKHWEETPAEVQQEVDNTVFTFLQHLNTLTPINLIRSGGQSGADVAGIRAAVRLRIPCEVNMSDDYMWRDAAGKDHASTYDETMKRFLASNKAGA